MAAGISKTTTIPLLLLTFIFSVAGLGLSAALVSKSNFPNYESRAVLIQGLIACVWTVLFSLIFIITGLVMPRNSFFGAAVCGIMMFLGFLQLIVTAGGTVSTTKTFGTPDNSALYRAWIAMAFIAAFMALFSTVAALLNYVAGKAVDVKPKQEEVVHF
ncbi:hypothetical protein JCM5353_007976 [Sporobolomyces roseus]